MTIYNNNSNNRNRIKIITIITIIEIVRIIIGNDIITTNKNANSTNNNKSSNHTNFLISTMAIRIVLIMITKE